MADQDVFYLFKLCNLDHSEARLHPILYLQQSPYTVYFLSDVNIVFGVSTGSLCAFSYDFSPKTGSSV